MLTPGVCAIGFDHRRLAKFKFQDGGSGKSEQGVFLSILLKRNWRCLHMACGPQVKKCSFIFFNG
jgi:hypothetical protein